MRGHLNATRVTQLERETRTSTEGLDAADVGIIMLVGGGRIHGMTVRASRWLEEYFGESKHRATRLPKRLEAWVGWHESAASGRDDLPPPRRPLVAQRDGKCLVVRLVGTSGHFMLLLTERYAELSVEPLAPLGLSRRETEVLKWVAEGKRDGEIAIILGISPRTVNHHVQRVCSKLGVETRTAAAACALRAVAQTP